MGFRFASAVVRSALAATKQVKLSDSVPRELVDDIFSSAIRKQTGVSLRYMLDFGANPIKRQLVLSAQFLHNELPVRLAHRVAELENLPYGLSAKPQVMRVSFECTLLYQLEHSQLAHVHMCVVPSSSVCFQVRDWYVESFRDLREFPAIKDNNDEQKFTDLLRHIYHRHRHVVPVMAMGVAELKKELQEGVGLLELPEIHQFLDGFYLSRIGIRILIGQHIALHEPEKDNYIGECLSMHAPAAWQHSKLAGHLYMSTTQVLAALLSGAVCDCHLLLKLADSGYHDW